VADVGNFTAVGTIFDTEKKVFSSGSGELLNVVIKQKDWKGNTRYLTLTVFDQKIKEQIGSLPVGTKIVAAGDVSGSVQEKGYVSLIVKQLSLTGSVNDSEEDSEGDRLLDSDVPF